MFLDDGRSIGQDAEQLMKNGPKLLMKIGSLDNLGAGVIGLCQTGPGYRILTLDPDFFGVHGAVEDHVLVNHELGHCILYRPHTSVVSTIPDGTGHTHEVSIMNPIIMGAAQYSFHEPYYVRELFQQLDLDGTPKDYICGEKPKK